MLSGWVKTHRSIVEWKWFTEPLTAHLFQFLICTAAWEDCEWKDVSIKRGQCVTGLNKLSAQTGISPRSLRTALQRLKSTHEVTVETTRHYSIITICNYDKYQSEAEQSDTQNDIPSDKQTTHNRHTTDKQTTTSKEYKNTRKKELKKNTYVYIGQVTDRTTAQIKQRTLEHVKLTQEQYNDLASEFSETILDELIVAMEDWIPNNRPLKDFPAALRNWYRRRSTQGPSRARQAYKSKTERNFEMGKELYLKALAEEQAAEALQNEKN
jgi:hypothetical protein